MVQTSLTVAVILITFVVVVEVSSKKPLNPKQSLSSMIDSLLNEIPCPNLDSKFGYVLPNSTRRESLYCILPYYEDMMAKFTAITGSGNERTAFTMLRNLENGKPLQERKQIEALHNLYTANVCQFANQTTKCVKHRLVFQFEKCSGPMLTEGAVKYLDFLIREWCYDDGQAIVDFLAAGGSACWNMYSRKAFDCLEGLKQNASNDVDICRSEELRDTVTCLTNLMDSCSLKKPTTIWHSVF